MRNHVSVASEPELVKNTWFIFGPACDTIFCASRVAGGVVVPKKGVVVRQLVHLPGYSVGDFASAVTDIDAPQTRKRIQIFLARTVVDEYAFGTLDDASAGCVQFAHVGKGMQVVGGVDGGEVR